MMFRPNRWMSLTACGLAIALGASLAPAAGRGGARGGGAAAGGQPRGPAPTLTTPTTPTTRPDDDGYIRRWSLLEPVPGQGVAERAFREAVTREIFPDQFKIVPQDGQTVKANGATLAWHACDSSRYDVNLYHFSVALNKPTGNMIWWAVTVINAPEEIDNVRLAVGSNDASLWWLNGQELVGLYENRMVTMDDGVSRKVTLKKGANILRAAIANEMGPTEFCARFLDANAQPIKNLTISLGDPAR